MEYLPLRRAVGDSLTAADAAAVATQVQRQVKDGVLLVDPADLHPSFSPDGSELIWGDDRGVEEVSVADPGDCASITPRLLIPGGSEPFFSAGSEQPSAVNPRQPGVHYPHAVFTFSPASPAAGAKVAFNGSKSWETSGSIVLLRWTFGDGKSARGKKVSHAYAKAGSYTVTLTVLDAHGFRASVKHKITVRR